MIPDVIIFGAGAVVGTTIYVVATHLGVVAGEKKLRKHIRNEHWPAYKRALEEIEKEKRESDSE